MTQAALAVFLEALAEKVELKARTGGEAAGIIRDELRQWKETQK